MLLKDLIQWLELQDASAVVRDGFGGPIGNVANYKERFAEAEHLN